MTRSKIKKNKKGLHKIRNIFWFYCLCGCGKRWEVNPNWKRYKKIFNSRCRYHYLKCLAKLGMLPVEGWFTCQVCKEQAPLFAYMHNYKYKVCAPWLLDKNGAEKKCVNIYRRKRIMDSVKPL